MRVQRSFTCLFFISLLFSCVDRKQNEAVTTETPIDSTRPELILKRINEAISKDSANASLFHQRALIQMKRGQFDAATEDMKSAVLRDSLNPDYYQLLADLAFRARRVQESVVAFKRSLELDPDDIEANLKFAELNLYLKAYPDAIKYANDALRLDERKAKAYFIKGFVYKETRDTGKAISSFQTVVEMDPENYDAYIQLGNLVAERRNPLALQYYNNALRLRPSSTEALYDRGLLLQNLGRLEPAISDYQAIIKLDPQYADAHFNLGYIRLVLQNDPAGAVTHFTDAIRISPEYVEAYYNRGMAYKLMGQKEATKKDFMKALGLFPTYKLAKQQLKEMM
ncbi:MAG: tetratricopeptide repeat protein [Bacteroidota bacterium]